MVAGVVSVATLLSARFRYRRWAAAVATLAVGQWAWAVHMWPRTGPHESSFAFGVSFAITLTPGWAAYAALLAASVSVAGGVLLNLKAEKS